jgi:RecA-family ATPase
VEGLLRAGWLLVINARPKVGKSIVSVNLALALAEGKSFLNLPTSPCAVLYIDLERPLETLNRFKVLNAQDNPNIFVPSERIGADMLETLQELIRQAKERTNRDVVVFVDTLGDFIKPALRQRRASINDYDAIAEILQELRDLALKLGCAFVFVHHTRKALSEEPTEVDVLGSTAIAGKFDVIAHLQPDKTESDTLSLIAEGNAIAKTILHFAISNDYRLEICEAPAKTKEEEAARFILEELKRHPEGLPRCEIERRIVERGMETTQRGAESLVGRALKEL